MGKGNPALEHMARRHSEIQRKSSPEDRAWLEELGKDLETGQEPVPDSRGREKNRVGTKDEETRQAGGGGWGSQEKGRWVCAYFSVLLVLTPGSGITQPFPSSAVRRHCHPLITCTHWLLHRRQPATGDSLSLFETQSHCGLWQSQWVQLYLQRQLISPTGYG